MNIEKSKWTTDGDQLNLNMPLSKVNVEERTVSGWASLDNLDLQKDIVLSSASEKAFSKFRGNIREMHQPIAVGKMLSYRPDSYYDAVTKTNYSGIWVDVYISKGAQSTWEKILDGTLQAFSIKGPIIDSESQFSKSSNETVRIIKEYELEELSVVDSGGNQLANVMSIAKVDGEFTVTGIEKEMASSNVFYCDKDRTAKTSENDKEICINEHSMVNIGWIEFENEESKLTKLQDKVSSHENQNQVVPENNEGGVDVSEEVVAEVAEVTEPETVVEVSELEVVEAPDFEKMFSDLNDKIEKGFSQSDESAKAAIKEATEAFEIKLAELATGHSELVQKFDGLRSELEGVEKSLNAVVSETAVRKSNDVGPSEEKIVKTVDKKSIWKGSFLGTSSLDED